MTARSHATTSSSTRRGSPARRAPNAKERAAFAVAPLVAPRLSVSFDAAFKLSPAQGLKVANTALQTAKPIAEKVKDTSELVHWAAVSRSVECRRTLVKAFRQSKQEMLLIQHLTELPRDQTDEFVKDYFAEGGSTTSVALWLQAVGSALREVSAGKSGSGAARNLAVSRTAVQVARKLAGKKAGATAGRVAAKSAVRAGGRAVSQVPLGGRPRLAGGWFDDVVDWVKDTVKKVGDAIGDAIGSVVDAIVKAGKSIASAISEAVNWTIDQVTDLVEALVKAGKKVGDILAAAVTKGVAQLKKFVQAVISAGRQLGEVLAWAAAQVAATAKAVVDQLLAMGRKVLDILKSVAQAAAATVTGVVKALLAAGKKVADILGAIASEALSVVQPLINGLLAAGQTLKAILTDAAKLVASGVRNVVSALVNLGKSATELLTQAAAAVGTALNAVVKALVDLGRSVGQLLQAVLSAAESVAHAVVKALLAAGKKLADIVVTAAGFVASAAAKVFKALVAAGKKVADILVTMAGRGLSALRTTVEALLSMGVALSALIKDIVLSVAEGFRQGFFQGLLALGKAPLLLLKAAAEVSVSVLLLAVAAIFELCGGHRSLTAAERAEAVKVFGSSIDLDRVKIATASVPADVLNWINGNRPFTTQYIINFGRNAVIDVATLIHEMTHVWQGVQEGPLYMTRALEAQIGAGVTELFHTGHYDDSEAYAVTDQELLDHAGDFSKFNPEEQASIVEHYWIQKFSGKPLASLPTVAQLEPYARQVFTPVRRAIPRPTVRATSGRAKAARA